MLVKNQGFFLMSFFITSRTVQGDGGVNSCHQTPARGIRILQNKQLYMKKVVITKILHL